jgi:hypothetical protein
MMNICLNHQMLGRFFCPVPVRSEELLISLAIDSVDIEGI